MKEHVTTKREFSTIIFSISKKASDKLVNSISRIYPSPSSIPVRIFHLSSSGEGHRGRRIPLHSLPPCWNPSQQRVINFRPSFPLPNSKPTFADRRGGWPCCRERKNQPRRKENLPGKREANVNRRWRGGQKGSGRDSPKTIVCK